VSALCGPNHFLAVVVVIRHDAKAAACGAPLLIVGAFVDHAVAVAILTSLHGADEKQLTGEIPKGKIVRVMRAT
jgi:hypothetical protein